MCELNNLLYLKYSSSDIKPYHRKYVFTLQEGTRNIVAGHSDFTRIAETSIIIVVCLNKTSDILTIVP